MPIFTEKSLGDLGQMPVISCSEKIIAKAVLKG
jgi:hypothetical protein